MFSAWLVRVLDGVVTACYTAGGIALGWRDRLDPPPAPAPELLAHVLVRIAPPEPVYLPTLRDAHAATIVEHYGDRSLFVLPFGSDQTHFVLDGNYGPCKRQVPPS